MDLPDDKQLLRRLKEGNKESFRIIFERNAPVFLAFARRLLRDPDVAEDIVQNVFMRLWIARERVDEERNLRNYLMVSVRNEIYGHLRMAFNARREPDSARVAEVEDSAPGLENELSARELERIVEKIVERMPSRRREIFTLSRRQHLSNAEIARQLGLSVRTVEKHIELALAEIRRLLHVSVLLLVTTIW